MFKRAPKGAGKRTRKVAVSEVPCPECGAQVGATCRNSSGGATGNHRARQRMAARKENQG